MFEFFLRFECSFTSSVNLCWLIFDPDTMFFNSFLNLNSEIHKLEFRKGVLLERNCILEFEAHWFGELSLLRRVPTFPSPACLCGWARQTLKHILLSCPRFVNGRKAMSRDAGTTDYLRLLCIQEGLRVATR